jgi:hypothetical protein
VKRSVRLLRVKCRDKRVACRSRRARGSINLS